MKKEVIIYDEASLMPIKKLKDYCWLCNEYKIKDLILNDKTYSQLSVKGIYEEFLELYIKTMLRNEGIII